MDKNAIKKYAVWARNELIARVSQKAQQYGITAEGYGDKNADSVNGVLLSATEKKQRQALIAKIDAEGFEQVMEEVAYTWFNRFTALRFMQVNNYLPSHTRVFTNEANEFKPQILSEAISLEFEGLDMDKVFELKNANKDEELYKYLLVVQCNALSSILPGMFQRISDYTELLLPDYLLRTGSVVEQMISIIPENDWTDQVQIIGWLYQYYNTEPKADVDLEIKNGGKVSKDTMPAKTQIFTPDWVVRYMVENSLGKYWTEMFEKADINRWNYFIAEDTLSTDKKMKPEDIRCIDPCMGSGHIICYLFEVLMQIYEDYGYSSRDAIENIVDKNLWGLDVDDRAAQLAYFAVMMKARKHDRRFFSRGIQPHVFSLKESKSIDRGVLDYFSNGNSEIRENLEKLISRLQDAKSLGSIIDLRDVNFSIIKARVLEIEKQGNIDLFSLAVSEHLCPIIEAAEALSQKYHIVVTNPPYLSLGDMPDKLATKVKDVYPDSKWDMFSVFIERARSLVVRGGYYALITQPSVITLSSFEKLRRKINSEQSLQSLLHMGRGIFGVDFGSTAFVIKNEINNGSKGNFYRLHEKTFQYIEPEDIEKLFRAALSNREIKCDFSLYDTKCGVTERMFNSENGRNLHFVLNPEVFNDVPGSPWIYEANEELLAAFKGNTLKDLATPKVGLQTGDNNKFTRLWFEVPVDEINFGAKSREDAANSLFKWFPYNKGGDYRKWYGNDAYIVNWENDGFEIRNFKNDKGKLKSRPQNLEYYFQQCVSWSKISAGSISFRHKQPGYIFDVAGTSFFANEDILYYLVGFCNSSVALRIAKMISPTMNYEVGHIASFPIIIDDTKVEHISDLVKECIAISKEEWDSYEMSWDFQKHPLINSIGEDVLLEDIFNKWKEKTLERFSRLKVIETEISRAFEAIYSITGDETALQDESISLRKADYEKDIKSLISYAVGCMFGRYSLTYDGIAYAGGTWRDERYSLFVPDKDNIIPICDDDYFDDDIVSLFVDFIATVYGRKNLEDNLQFIANALKGSGTSRDVIREYFLNDFYNDHGMDCTVSISGKRPYYWMFDSGKKNGFKCLMYMHRYRVDTIARIRTDYVHEQQSRYRTALADLEQRVNNASTSERVKLNKQLKTIQDQAEELRKYEEKIHHLADQMISIDLDDGVKENYAKFQDVLAKIK